MERAAESSDAVLAQLEAALKASQEEVKRLKVQLRETQDKNVCSYEKDWMLFH